MILVAGAISRISIQNLLLFNISLINIQKFAFIPMITMTTLFVFGKRLYRKTSESLSENFRMISYLLVNGFANVLLTKS